MTIKERLEEFEQFDSSKRIELTILLITEIVLRSFNFYLKLSKKETLDIAKSNINIWLHFKNKENL